MKFGPWSSSPPPLDAAPVVALALAFAPPRVLVPPPRAFALPRVALPRVSARTLPLAPAAGWLFSAFIERAAELGGTFRLAARAGTRARPALAADRRVFGHPALAAHGGLLAEPALAAEAAIALVIAVPRPRRAVIAVTRLVAAERVALAVAERRRNRHAATQAHIGAPPPP